MLFFIIVKTNKSQNKRSHFVGYHIDVQCATQVDWHNFLPSSGVLLSSDTNDDNA